MALQNTSLLSQSATPHYRSFIYPKSIESSTFPAKLGFLPRRRTAALKAVVDSQSGGAGGDSKKAVPNTNYVVPLDKVTSSCVTRPLAEILRDLNKRIPDNILKPQSNIIPWFHANRMLSFYAPGWCGEVRDVIFSDDGSITVVYRVIIRGSDGEAYREATGTIMSSDTEAGDPVAGAEELAFVKACARFGLGLYLYHDQ
ncbi:DNA repair RAD52-like protein 2, chloroplastic [Silene latifolia]|uniref:DNA repair RAD52-like protein 2, chloroplastic n=1 Tax=Silene latifolia TaxID=37657 RepID=UPI003D778EEE